MTASQIYISYTEDESHEVTKLIKKAELKSAQTCEICGNPGEIHRIKNWYACRCSNCK